MNTHLIYMHFHRECYVLENIISNPINNIYVFGVYLVVVLACKYTFKVLVFFIHFCLCQMDIYLLMN